MKVQYCAAASIGVLVATFSGVAAAQDRTDRTDRTTRTWDGVTDHGHVVGNFAIGFLGFRSIGIPAVPNGPTSVDAPVIGGRYWLTSGMGVDAGLGFAFGSGSNTVDAGGTSTDTDDPQPAALILHGGLPLALADSHYFVFEVVPELNMGFAGNTVQQAGNDVVLRGFHLDLGARAGAEIHFGFIDLPQLSLQAGVGVALSYDRTSIEDTGPDTTVSNSRTQFGTNVGNNPWDIFSASVAALYYFGS
jgi:hypothetical protein